MLPVCSAISLAYKVARIVAMAVGQGILRLLLLLLLLWVLLRVLLRVWWQLVLMLWVRWQLVLLRMWWKVHHLVGCRAASGSERCVVSYKTNGENSCSGRSLDIYTLPTRYGSAQRWVVAKAAAAVHPIKGR